MDEMIVDGQNVFPNDNEMSWTVYERLGLLGARRSHRLALLGGSPLTY